MSHPASISSRFSGGGTAEPELEGKLSVPQVAKQVPKVNGLFLAEQA